MFHTSTLLPFGLLVIAAGCPAIKGPPAPFPDCTDDALLASISLTVVDNAGSPIPDPVATFSVDGGEEQDCEDFGDGSLQCGLEEAGEFAVSIRADGYSDDVFTQSVETDACHVLTEHIERTLTPVDRVPED